MKNRFLCLLTAAVMVASGGYVTNGFSGIQAEASDEYEIVVDNNDSKGDITYHVYSDYAVVYESDSDITIANVLSTINGVPVTEISDKAFSGAVYHNDLTTVRIPDSITKIGKKAFSCCSQLSSINIPDSVTEIGEGAFYNCDALTSITLPEYLTSIENATFRYCDNLESINIPDSVSTVGKDAFKGCTALKEIIFPESVESIGSGLFCDASWSGFSLKVVIENQNCVFDVTDNSMFPQYTVIWGYVGSRAEEYAKKHTNNNIIFRDIENPYTSGDIDSNNVVDAVDASNALGEYARKAVGASSQFDSTQKLAADVNEDNVIDAVDASQILSYYAYLATADPDEQTDSPEVYFYKASKQS